MGSWRMRAGVGIALILLVSGAARAEKPALDVRPVADGWKCSVADVKKVLLSSGGVLTEYFPGLTLKPIIVDPQGGPIVLFQRGPGGEYRVKLATGERLWAQCAFQFAHEMGHILCQYKPGDNANKWFEESICETASLFALRRMAVDWQTQPPYPNWKGYSSALKDYAQQRLDKAVPPKGTTFVEWFKQEEAALRKDAGLREKNLIVAGQLLPLLEADPSCWAAVGALNAGTMSKDQTLKEYLAQWQEAAAAEHRPFVAKVAARFGVELPTTKPSAAK